MRKQHKFLKGGEHLERPRVPCHLLPGISSSDEQIYRFPKHAKAKVINSTDKDPPTNGLKLCTKSTTELEWSLDERDKENVMEARAVLDSLDIDNDLEVFHFKVSVD